MEFTTLPIEQLREWRVNKRLRAITEENYTKLKDKLTLKPQFKPLIITPDDFEPGIYDVLAGNHRLKAYTDLGVTELWVQLVTFEEDEQGLWHSVVDGNRLAETFHTKVDAMLDWSLVDNEESAFYDREMIINEMDQYTIDWENYNLNMDSPLSVPRMLEKFGLNENPTEEDTDVDTDEEVKEDMKVLCPECHHEFIAKEYRV